jgi:hypothetical protein
MNKTQSIDGIILGPQHACHMSHKPGINRRLKAEASHSVRQAYKHVVVQEPVNMDEIDVHLDEDRRTRRSSHHRGANPVKVPLRHMSTRAPPVV